MDFYSKMEWVNEDVKRKRKASNSTLRRDPERPQGKQSGKLQGDPDFHPSQVDGGPFEEVEGTGAGLPEGTGKG